MRTRRSGAIAANASTPSMNPAAVPGSATARRRVGDRTARPQPRRSAPQRKLTSESLQKSRERSNFAPGTCQKVPFLARVDGDFAAAPAMACSARVGVLPTNILWDWHLLGQGGHAMFARCSLGRPNGPKDGASALGSVDACVEVAQSPANPYPPFSTTRPTR